MRSDLFGLYFDGPPFTLFSLAHLLPLAAIVLICVLIGLLTPRLGSVGQERLRWGLALFACANWIGWDLWQLANGIWNVAYSLPLHLCTFSVPLSALMLATRNYRLYEVLYFWGFAGGTQALLTPDLTATGFNFPHFVYWIFWTSHGVVLWAVVFAAAAWRYRPTWGSIRRVVVFTGLFALGVGLVNWLTGGNYLFIARTPEFPSLIDYLGPWPWYIIPLLFLSLLAFLLVYAPYALSDWLRERRSLAPSRRLGQE
ncbi:MAG: TIGR02206 family membrane protein [Chloroflexaceae bacterium]